MNCPWCGTAMEPGRLVYKVGFRESVLGGSYRQLWFAPEGGTEELTTVLAEGPRPAFRCRTCGGIGIPGEAAGASA